MKKIYKKVLPEYYREIVQRRKSFELRKDEDNAQVGDILVLREWDGQKYTGHKVEREVTYILRDVPEYGLAPGYCIMAMMPVDWNKVEVYYVPSGSAAGVVHCRDCEWWEKPNEPEGVFSAQGRCVLFSAAGPTGHYPTGGWYCANGRRRQNGDV